jgi:hypothetical protein
MNKSDNKTLNIPAPGDVIYIESFAYIDHGWDDILGGRATVSKITKQPSGGMPTPFVEVEEIPGRAWNWEWLAGRQERLATEFRGQRARPDPDWPPATSLGDRVRWYEGMYGEEATRRALREGWI